MLTNRQNQILQQIVENYVFDAQPISSKLLTDSLNVSSATIRNEMAVLEEKDLIFQPHTSAGRVPTVAGYKYYFDNFVDKNKLLNKRDQQLVLAAWQKSTDYNQSLKNLAKVLADISQHAVLVGFSEKYFYYTGLSNLFNKPEFTAVDLVRAMGYLVDHLDEVVSKIFPQVDDLSVKIGDENPFSNECSVLLTKFSNSSGEGLLGILGPMRMDYQQNFSLINYSRNLINK